MRKGEPTPYYLDSATTGFVANDDAAARKSVWLQRRIHLLHEGVTEREIVPMHISEKFMAADPLTKYLPYNVWARHMLYIMNYRQNVKDWNDVGASGSRGTQDRE